MPTDHHGVTHAGAIGLFDDDDENAATLASAERHEIAGLEKVIRCEERSTKRKLRKEDKAAQREVECKPNLPRPVSWLNRLFSASSSESSLTRLAEEESETDDEKKTTTTTKKKKKRVKAEWTVVRRPVAPDAVYTAQDVDPVDSPFLRECGMVRVVSDDAGGCHIVPKSTIQKNN
ncbi:hypothetical protein CC86DRAFT_151206 [Ophiobolus disseminans]|uniref:Uncharacterized protein n=1 Tax=Ophiobolus disseminans TaxID=1469910 RepID=A0A6A6ZCS2_9PLEO|nr:hypothetical protein CC86DRAFT_151206 [Ophiobolus disseminans]